MPQGTHHLVVSTSCTTYKESVKSYAIKQTTIFLRCCTSLYEPEQNAISIVYHLFPFLKNYLCAHRETDGKIRETSVESRFGVLLTTKPETGILFTIILVSSPENEIINNTLPEDNQDEFPWTRKIFTGIYSGTRCCSMSFYGSFMTRGELFSVYIHGSELSSFS